MLEISCVDQHVFLLISTGKSSVAEVFSKDHMMAEVSDSASLFIGSVLLPEGFIKLFDRCF